jgi:hypothetical protein
LAKRQALLFEKKKQKTFAPSPFAPDANLPMLARTPTGKVF